jgi:hypothetical protein
MYLNLFILSLLLGCVCDCNLPIHRSYHLFLPWCYTERDVGWVTPSVHTKGVFLFICVFQRSMYINIESKIVYTR